jgi:hypothetical protein
MTKETHASIKKKKFYQGMLLLAAAVYILLIFVEPSSETEKNSVSLVRDCLSLLMDILVVFWIRRQVMIISLILFSVFFNLKLLINPLLIRVDYFYTYNFHWATEGLLIIGIIFLGIGLWPNIPFKFARKEFHFKGYLILVPILISTLLIQTISRICF